MTSSLTSASLKSGIIYIILISGIIFGVLYLFFIKQPSVRDTLYLQALKLNYSAFKNGIKLANHHFIAHQSSKSDNTFNLWNNDEVGLDFNDLGYPIGTEIVNPQQQSVETASHCLQIWQFLMAPLPPPASIVNDKGSYRVQMSKDGFCRFQSTKLSKISINYDPLSGKTSIVDRNSE